MRKANIYTLLTALFMCCSAWIVAQPANDLCSGAVELTCNNTVNGTTVGSTFDDVGFCGTSNTAGGVWYTITGTGGAITLSTCNQASYDTKITVFSGICGGDLTCVGGQDDAAGCSGFTTEFAFLSSTGVTYYVLIHGFGTATGTFDLTATCAPVATANDDCGGALAISCGGTVSGSTSEANSDDAAFCGTSNTAPGVWYEFSPDEDALATATTCSNNTDYDTKISVFSGSCAALVCEDGNDDDFTCVSSIFHSTVDWVASAGNTYYILVHGFSSASGDFDLSLSCSPLAANDAPCDAEALVLGTTSNYNNVGATADAGEVSPGPGTGVSSCNSQDGWCSFETDPDNSLWYTFQAPSSGAVSISAGGFDSQIGVYAVGDCADYSTYSELGGNDDSGPGLESFLELYCLTPGDTYYVQVDGFGGASSNNGYVLVEAIDVELLSCDAGDCQTKFVGYEPAEGLNHLIVTASGGVAPYTYAWSGDGVIGDGDVHHISVDPSETTEYTVTVTDAVGCVTTCSVTVYVQDVTCYGGGKPGNGGNAKVNICHAPPGNPDNEGQMCVSPNSVEQHLAHGDLLGECGNTCLATNPPPPACVDLSVSITTDNFGGETSWELADASGAVIASGGGLSSATTYTVFEDCVFPGCYSVTLFDTFGDGICCQWGQGTWSVTYDGETTVSPTGGDFGSSETISVGCNGVRTTSATVPSAESKVIEAATVSVYPNPFNSSSVIRVMPVQDGNAVVDIIDLNGQVVSALYNGSVKRGSLMELPVNGEQLNNSGIYIYRVQLAGETFTGKIVYAH